MAKVTLQSLSSLSNESSAIALINANFAELATFLESVLNRDGTDPNTLTDSLDVNSQVLYNLPEATQATQPVTYQQLIDAAVGEGVFTFAPTDDSVTDAITNGDYNIGVLARTMITPERYGAVGDGVTDDTTAVKAAFTAAGRNGIVYCSATYLLSSNTGYVECRRTGPGKFKIGSTTWPATTDLWKASVPQNTFPDGKTVSSANYSAFPVAERNKNGVIAAQYYRGYQHGQDDEEAICLSQAKASAGDLTINGYRASGGTVSNPTATRVSIRSSGNDTGINITIYGEVNGVATTVTTAGPNATVKYTTESIKNITRVSVSGAVAGTIMIGFYMLGSNQEIRYSLDNGNTFSSAIEIGAGLTSGATHNYAPGFGVTTEGKFISIFNSYNVPVTTFNGFYRSASWDGILWSTPATVTYNLQTFTSSAYFYGKIKSTPGGTLVASIYNTTDKKTYCAKSTDDGLTWNLYVLDNTASPYLTETAILPLDENNFIAVSRVNGATSSMYQFKSTDGGQTWTSQGNTNLATSGGWVSPELVLVNVLGEPYAVLVYYARDSASAPPAEPNAFQIRAVRSAVALTTSTSWSDYNLLGTASAPGNSGYPSPVYNPQTGQLLIVYGIESALNYACSVKTVTHDIKKVITNLRLGSLTFDGSSSLGNFVNTTVWTPALSGTGGVAPTYTTQYGRYMRIGPVVIATFRITVNGAISLTGPLKITGFPVAASLANVETFQVSASSVVTAEGVHGRMDSGATTATLLQETGSTVSSFTDADANTNLDLRGVAVYFV